jgi:hypothetical protein
MNDDSLEIVVNVVCDRASVDVIRFGKYLY